MKKIVYTIKDELGIHVRPAGLLVKEIQKYESDVTIEKNGKSVSGRKLMALMGLGVKRGETVSVTVEGSDEESAAAAVEAFLKENL